MSSTPSNPIHSLSDLYEEIVHAQTQRSQNIIKKTPPDIRNEIIAKAAYIDTLDDNSGQDFLQSVIDIILDENYRKSVLQNVYNRTSEKGFGYRGNAAQRSLANIAGQLQSHEETSKLKATLREQSPEKPEARTMLPLPILQAHPA